jgi:hypothetical protein
MRRVAHHDLTSCFDVSTMTITDRPLITAPHTSIQSAADRSYLIVNDVFDEICAPERGDLLIRWDTN